MLIRTQGSHVIPAQAIEAAAKAYRREFPYDENEGYVVKLILEAAAPHMLAECWEASAKATADYELEYRVSFDFGDDLPEPPANPYRPTP